MMSILWKQSFLKIQDTFVSFSIGNFICAYIEGQKPHYILPEASR